MKFYVNWDDPPYPKIQKHNELCGHTPRTFTECKAEIKEHALDLIGHWRMVLDDTRKLRVADVED